MIIAPDVIDRIRRHGEDTYPEECCGLLLGRSGPHGNEVEAAWRAINRNEDRRNDRYVIAPEDYVAADREARKRGLDVVGVYHSHPDHPARPSATDLLQATFPGFTYVIVSVRSGHADELTAWSLVPDRSRFLREDVLEREPVRSGDD